MEALRGGSPHLPGRATAHLSLVGGRAVRSRDHHKGWAGLRGAADVGRQRAAWDARAAAQKEKWRSSRGSTKTILNQL